MIVDETFREATYNNHAVSNSFSTYGDNVIVVGSLSKGHGAPGLRIGWLVCHDKELLRQLITAKVDISISCSIIDELLAIAVLKREQVILGERRILLQDGLQIVKNWIERNEEKVEWISPDAGAFCAVRLKKEKFTPDQVEAFYNGLSLHEARVSAGNWFKDERRVFRLGFGALPLNKLKLGLQELENLINSISKPLVY